MNNVSNTGNFSYTSNILLLRVGGEFMMFILLCFIAYMCITYYWYIPKLVNKKILQKKNKTKN